MPYPIIGKMPRFRWRGIVAEGMLAPLPSPASRGPEPWALPPGGTGQATQHIGTPSARGTD